MPQEKTCQILHISDLHIKEKQHFDRSLVFDPFIERLQADKNEYKLTPEIVIVTGDIAWHGFASEYRLAKSFFDQLLECLELSEERLFIVPGNHDVNRDKCPRHELKYENAADLNHDLEHNKEHLLKAMTDYFSFIEEYYAHLKPIHDNLIPFVQEYQTNCGKTIHITGLNSAWMCRKSPDKENIAIGEYQVKMAMDELRSKEDVLRLNCFHHPLTWLWDEDRMRIHHFFDHSILLYGHVHDVAGGYSCDYNGSLYQFQAGGLYLCSESEKPQRFQYLTLDWDQDLIKIDIRKFNKTTRKWVIDADTADDGKKSFPMMKESRKTKVVKNKYNHQFDTKFKPYKQNALAEHRYLPMQGFETTMRVLVELERVYVNMRGHIQWYDFENTREGKQQWEERISQEKLDSLDIKSAFGIVNETKIKDMVILGDPGSGKTTLLKYILVMLIQSKAEKKLGLDSAIIPFFAPLRELENPDSISFMQFIRNSCSHSRWKITKSDLKKVLDDGQAIILLDGLDEVADEKMRIKVCKWIDEARKTFVNTSFIITSRFAGYQKESKLDDPVLELNIRDFNPDEMKYFLIHWFEAVEDALHPGDDTDYWKEKGSESAQELIRNILDSEALKKLAVNPLMLQIMALIRKDRNTALPDRRVELYDECINVLLEKWDMAKGLKGLISAREARIILQPVALYLHKEDQRRSAPMDEIVRIIRDPLKKLGKSEMDPKKLLLNIRDRSGIFMGYSESEYGFTHLSFQEFLAAEQIRITGERDLLIRNYNNKWWREVILLYLAQDNPPVIEPFMEQIIRTRYFKSDITLIMQGIDDSLIKPETVFMQALKEKKLKGAAYENLIRMLYHIQKEQSMPFLKKIITEEENIEAAQAVYTFLKQMNETKGVPSPYRQEAPGLIRHSKDDSEMVLIPEGSFLFGSREDDKNARSNEKPQQTLHLPDFYMDVNPVTNRQYCKFLNAVKPDQTQLEKWIDIEGKFRKERCRIIRDKNNYSVENNYDHYPVIYVTWYGAGAYAEWSGKRLPTEHEWEKAARGTDGRVWPWGNEFDRKYCNSDESGIDHSTKAGRFPDGKSPYGCHDMAGNVWEWTASPHVKGSSLYVLRGGSWDDPSYYCRCAIRLWFDPGDRDFRVGFRCARI